MRYTIIDTYTTKASDTIYKIAIRYYYVWYLWRIIYDPNKDILGENPYYIPPGKTIHIVGLNTEPIIHTVESGDTYQHLSKSYYGSSLFFIDIAIENNYKHLIPGDSCIIPALVSKEHLTKAEKLRALLNT
ncbi:MAG: hypothetical protein QHH74_10515 [Spirochaetota bacterium]|nr:hypothetical protein [Spirochaetota bacterium]